MLKKFSHSDSKFQKEWEYSDVKRVYCTLVYRDTDQKKIERLNEPIHAIVQLQWFYTKLRYRSSERKEPRHDSFIQSRTTLRVASSYQSIARFAKHVPCLAESFHENTNAGGRRFAFCFRKAFDSVGDHYTSRVHVSSATSFHPINAYVSAFHPECKVGFDQNFFYSLAEKII